MTAQGYRDYLAKAREKYLAAHHVEPIRCVECEADVSPRDRIMRKTYVDPADGRRKKQIGLSDYCVGCRMARAPSVAALSQAAGRKWGTFDYFAWAEETLYPDTPYLRMTWEERQHCYWLARVRWAHDGLYACLMGALRTGLSQMAREERRRLKALRMTLAKHGRRVTDLPFVEWLDADADPDHYERTTGSPARGRHDADADRDVAGTEAEDLDAVA